MNEERKHIDNIIRDKLFNYSPPPPPGAWKKIEADLNQSKNRFLTSPLLRIVAVIAVITGLTAATLFYVNNRQTPLRDIATNATESPDNNLVNQSVNHKLTEERKVENTNIQKRYIKEKNLPVTSTNTREISFDRKENISFVTEIKIAEDEIVNENSNYKLIPNNNVVFNDTTNTEYIVQPEVKRSNQFITEDKPDLIADLSRNAEKFKPRSLQWLIGGQFGPQYSYTKAFQENVIRQVNDYEEKESAVVAYAGGFNVQMQPSKRFSVQSGVYYSKIGTSVSATRSVSPTSSLNLPEPEFVLVDTGRSPGSQPVIIATFNYSDNSSGKYISPEVYLSRQNSELKAEQYSEYVEIPLVLKYKIVDKKLDINISGGVWTHFLISSKTVIVGENNYLSRTVSDRTENINSFDYSGSLGLGIDYPVSPNILVNLNPVFKYYLSSDNSRSGLKPYTFGIMTGFSYSF
ncbi:MAG: PorT family protein [Bacteroidales bacterium]|nr:PorT family protein [Bacteroidales bacterium]